MTMNQCKKLTTMMLATYADLGNLSSRSMFGGYGLLLDGTMFAWIVDDTLYLRAAGKYSALFTQLDMPPLTLSTGVVAKLLNYFAVTEKIWQDDTLLRRLMRYAIEGAFADRDRRLRQKEHRLKDLPNITLSLERALLQIGVDTILQLKRIGATETYRLLKASNKSISINVLFILASAINNHHVALLSSEQKHQLKDEFKQLAHSAQHANPQNCRVLT